MPDQPRATDLPTLASRVERNLVRRCGVEPESRILLAVSGGADSIALFALLFALAPRLKLELEIAHFDHALRPESEDDARFVAGLAREASLPIHIERWKDPRPGEAAARTARYEFLATTAKKRSCASVALAHHLDDRIETMLLQLSRGASLRGLTSMRWRRVRQGCAFVRPLLDLPKATLRDLLAQHELGWREDSTNSDRRIARNRLRLDALPALDAALRPGWLERAGDALDDLASAQRRIEKLATRALAAARLSDSTETLDPKRLGREPEIVLRTALRIWFEKSGVASERRHLTRRHLRSAERIVRNDRSDQHVSLPGGWTLHRDQSGLRLEAAGPTSAPRAAIPSLSWIQPPEDLVLQVIELAPREALREIALEPRQALRETELEPRQRKRAIERERTAPESWHEEAAPPNGGEISTCLGGDSLSGPLRVRFAEPGEKVQLFGAPGTRRLRRILQDHRVPSRFRAIWPIVADAKGIVWVPGVGIAERGRIGPGSQRALRLRIAGRPSRQPPAGPPDPLVQAPPAH